MNTLFILNEPAYGNERSDNGLRLALSLAKSGQTEVRVFLMGDAMTCAMFGQKTPDGYYNLERMLKGCGAKGVDIVCCGAKGVDIACCGTCIDARGISEELLTDAARRSTLAELTEWTLWADKVLVFQRRLNGPGRRVDQLSRGQNGRMASMSSTYTP